MYSPAADKDRRARARSRRPLSVLLLIRSLEIGGAERQLVELAAGLNLLGHDVRVAVFYRRGALTFELERHGIDIIDLKKKGRWDIASFLARLVWALRLAKPDVLYSFLGGANIAAAAASPFVRGSKLVWSIRASNVDLAQYDWTHRAAYRLERSMSGLADAIISNSNSGRLFAAANGFPKERIDVVQNGVDIERFRPDEGLRNRQRHAWGLATDQVAVGMLARLDPMKDYPTFLRAAELLRKREPGYCFLCVGEGPERKRLEALAAELGLTECVTFVGQADPVAALNGFDVACSSSIAEGFPNAVAEAMACGKPCVVTDAGDSSLIVGDLGAVVSPRDPEALAGAVLRELELTSEARSAARRQRIVNQFSVDAMVERTLKVLEQALGPPAFD